LWGIRWMTSSLGVRTYRKPPRVAPTTTPVFCWPGFGNRIWTRSPRRKSEEDRRGGERSGEGEAWRRDGFGRGGTGGGERERGRAKLSRAWWSRSRARSSWRRAVASSDRSEESDEWDRRDWVIQKKSGGKLVLDASQCDRPYMSCKAPTNIQSSLTSKRSNFVGFNSVWVL